MREFTFRVHAYGTSPIRTLFVPIELHSQFAFFAKPAITQASWSVDTEGYLSITSNQAALAGRYHLEHLDLSDYIFQLVFTHTPSDNDMVGAVFRYRDPFHFYLVGLDAGGEIGWGEANFRLYRVVGDRWTLLAQTSYPVDRRKWYDLTVQLSGPHIRVLLRPWQEQAAEPVVLELDDPEPLSSGAFGPAAYSQPGARWMTTGLYVPSAPLEVVKEATGTVNEVLHRSEQTAALLSDQPVGIWIQDALAQELSRRGAQVYEASVHRFVVESLDPQVAAFFAGYGSETTSPEAYLSAYYAPPAVVPVARVLAFAPELTGPDRVRWSWVLSEGSAIELWLVDADSRVRLATMSPSQTSLEEADLSPGTTVRRQLVVVGESGQMSESDVVAFTLPSEQLSPPLPPTDVQGQALSATSIRWTWKLADRLAEGVEIYDAESHLLLTTLIPAVEAWQEDNLSPATSYSRYVVAFNAAGRSDPSGVAQQATLPSAAQLPPAPVAFYGFAKDTTTIRWVWQFDGVADGFWLYADDGTPVAQIPGELRAYEETGLEPGKLVGRYLVAFNGLGFGPPSETFYQAPFGLPETPPNPKVTWTVSELPEEPLLHLSVGVVGEEDLRASLPDAPELSERAWALVALEGDREVSESVLPAEPFSYRIVGEGERRQTREGGRIALALEAYPPVLPRVRVDGEVSGELQVTYQWHGKASHTDVRYQLEVLYGEGAKLDVLIVHSDKSSMQGQARTALLAGLMDWYTALKAAGIFARFGGIRVFNEGNANGATFRCINGPSDRYLSQPPSASDFWLTTDTPYDSFYNLLASRVLGPMNDTTQANVRHGVDMTLGGNGRYYLASTTLDDTNAVRVWGYVHQHLDDSWNWGAHNDWVKQRITVVAVHRSTGNVYTAETGEITWEVYHRALTDFAPISRDVNFEVKLQGLPGGMYDLYLDYAEWCFNEGPDSWILDNSYAKVQGWEEFGVSTGRLLSYATQAMQNAPFDSDAAKVVLLVSDHPPAESGWAPADRSSVIGAFRSTRDGLGALCMAYSEDRSDNAAKDVAHHFYGSAAGTISTDWASSATRTQASLSALPSRGYHVVRRDTIPHGGRFSTEGIASGEDWKPVDARTLRQIIMDAMQAGQTSLPATLFSEPLRYGNVTCRVLPYNLGPTLALSFNGGAYPFTTEPVSDLSRTLWVRTANWAWIHTPDRHAFITLDHKPPNYLVLDDGQTIDQVLRADGLADSVMQPLQYGNYQIVAAYGTLQPSDAAGILPATEESPHQVGRAYANEVAEAFTYRGSREWAPDQPVYADDAFALRLGSTDDIELFHITQGWRYDGDRRRIRFTLTNLNPDQTHAALIDLPPDSSIPKIEGSREGWGTLQVYAYATAVAQDPAVIDETLGPGERREIASSERFASFFPDPALRSRLHLRARVVNVPGPGIYAFWQSRQSVLLDQQGERAGVGFPDVLCLRTRSYHVWVPYQWVTPWIDGKLAEAPTDHPVAVMVPVAAWREDVRWSKLWVELKSAIPLRHRWERPAPDYTAPFTTDPDNVLWIWTGEVRTQTKRRAVRSLAKVTPAVDLKVGEKAIVDVRFEPEDWPYGSDVRNVRLVVVGSSPNVVGRSLFAPMLPVSGPVTFPIELSLQGVMLAPWELRLAGGEYAIHQHRFARYPFKTRTFTPTDGRVVLPEPVHERAPVLVRAGSAWLFPSPLVGPDGWPAVEVQDEWGVGKDPVELGTVLVDPERICVEVYDAASDRWDRHDGWRLEGSRLFLGVAPGTRVRVTLKARRAFALRYPDAGGLPVVELSEDVRGEVVEVFYVPKEQGLGVASGVDLNPFRHGMRQGLVFLDTRPQSSRRAGKVMLRAFRSRFWAGRAYPMSVHVVDTDGIPYDGATVQLAASAGELDSSWVVTDTTGTAFFVWEAPTEPGEALLTAASGSEQATLRIRFELPPLAWGQRRVAHEEVFATWPA